MIQVLFMILAYFIGVGTMFITMIKLGYIHPGEILKEDKTDLQVAANAIKEFNWDTYCTICFSKTSVIKHTMELCPKCSDHILRLAIDYRGN